VEAASTIGTMSDDPNAATSPTTARPGMELPPETLDDLQLRLRRIEGQVRGLQQMLAEERDCRDVVTQIAAANKALEQVGFVLVSAGLTWCVQNPERSSAAGYDIGDVQKMFLKLA
jgi:DNA-binding FrmR family transcriptional regulator